MQFRRCLYRGNLTVVSFSKVSPALLLFPNFPILLYKSCGLCALERLPAGVRREWALSSYRGLCLVFKEREEYRADIWRATNLWSTAYINILSSRDFPCLPFSGLPFLCEASPPRPCPYILYIYYI